MLKISIVKKLIPFSAILAVIQCLVQLSSAHAVNSQVVLGPAGGHTAGLKSDGSVVAVGNNSLGQLNVSNWSDIVQVAVGGVRTVGLKSDGSVVAVGGNSDGQLNVSSWSNIVQVAAGTFHTVGLKSDGSVVAVGRNSEGQLNVNSWSDIVQVAAGYVHTVGLKSDGSVVAVGDNSDGQLNVSSWSNIVQVAAGTFHTVGLKSDGSVVAIGDNSDGQLNVSSWSDIVQVAAGYDHTVGLKSDGRVVAVGDNYWVQLNVSSWSDIVQVAAGLFHTAGLKSDGRVVAVGINTTGQLGATQWRLLSTNLIGTIQSEISDAEVTTGDLVPYRICVENNDSTIQNAVEIINPIPIGTIFDNATSSFNYDEQAQEVRWNIGSLLPGSKVCVGLTLQVTASPGTLLSNAVKLKTDQLSTILKPYLTNITDNTIQKIQFAVDVINDAPPLEYFNTDYLELYDPINVGFREGYPTFIISHGHNPSLPLPLSAIPGWQEDMAELIWNELKQDRDDPDEESPVNIYMWNWQINAWWDNDGVHPIQRIFGIPHNKVKISGKRLAKEIENRLPIDYEKDIHFIGHSLGSGVVSYAAKYIYDEDLKYKTMIKRITLLDSPYYFDKPGGDFYTSSNFINNTMRPKVDNYYSALGRPFTIDFGKDSLTMGFPFADTNVLLCNILGPFSGHSFAHKWFNTTIADFRIRPSYVSEDNYIDDIISPPLGPGEHLEYGFYWEWLEGSEPYWSHIFPDPHWDLSPEPVVCLGMIATDYLQGVLVDTADMIQGMYIDPQGFIKYKKDELIENAEKTKTKIEILAVQAFDTAQSVSDSVTDYLDHSNWVNYTVSGLTYNLVRLSHASDASLSMDMNIPPNANSFRFSYEFPMADEGSVLEVFINEVPLMVINCEDHVQKGWQKSEWINVSSLAGQQVNLVFRMSNPVTNTHGVVHLDDIILANIIPSVDTDLDLLLNGEDNCPQIPNADQLDSDSDDVGDVCDACPSVPNPDQVDDDCDCDVDGSDLSAFVAGSEMYKVGALASNFGRTECP